MIDPKKELFKWGPIDGKPIYIDPFTFSYAAFPKYYDGTWPDLLGYFNDDKITFFADNSDLCDEGENLYHKYIADKQLKDKEYERWQEATKKILAFEKLDLSTLSKDDLSHNFDQFVKAEISFWLAAILPELSNWGAERILIKSIKKNHPDNFAEIFEKMSAPEDLSFFKTEEREFLKLKLIDDPQSKKKALIDHQQKYYWLNNNYGETHILNLAYFENELGKIDEQLARQKINQIDCYTQDIKYSKEEIISKYKLSSEIIKLSKDLSYCVWWQDLRKKYIFIINHIITQFVKEISKRKNIDFNDLAFYRQLEILELLKNNQKIDISNRKKGFILYYHRKGEVNEIEGDQANIIIKPYFEVKIDSQITEIKGLVVSRGKLDHLTGKVCLLFSPKDVHKMSQGDILVAPMTSPDFIVAMRKASAIITDEGGMTSHAAIVSRELKIPCIVATKIATKILNDGDVVEIDTDEGVVRILEEK